MEPAETYAAVAAARARELHVRLIIGAFIAASSYVIAPSLWPALWFLSMTCGQLLDRVISRRVGAIGDMRISTADKGLRIASVLVNSTIYGSITLHLWFNGGPAGSWFALLLCCGGMLHVSLRTYPSRWLLFAGAVPHAIYLLGIPLLIGALTPEPDLFFYSIVTIGGALYVAHLIVGARLSQAGLNRLRNANNAANQARELAERASAAKTEFLTMISHEIRTPMNAVLSATHLLGRTSLSPEQREHVAMLTNGGEVLIGLLNDVLDISKIEAGKMVLDEADLDLTSALDALAKLYQPRFDATGVVLKLDIAAAPAAIRTDPLRLRQILFNLLSNAAKFTEKGEVVVRAGTRKAGAADWLWFEIEDTGCGIDAEAMGRLFGSFEQARATTARHHGGTGLGLAISRRLAEMMGGSLDCQSIVGQGSVFRLELPLAPALDLVGPASAPANDSDEAPPRLSILVAEDHEVNRRIVSLFLEPLGWRLTMAEDGAQAVEAAAHEAYDVILMDMQMPVMNGLEAAQAIRDGGGPNAATPIIALTANALDHHREVWKGIGAAAFLTKPIDPKLLVATVIAVAKTERRQAVAVA